MSEVHHSMHNRHPQITHGVPYPVWDTAKLMAQGRGNSIEVFLEKSWAFPPEHWVADASLGKVHKPRGSVTVRGSVLKFGT